jgi:hypothetical protein
MRPLIYLAIEGHLDTIKFSADTKEDVQTSTAQEILEIAFDVLRISTMTSNLNGYPPVARRVKIYLKDGSVDVRTVLLDTPHTALK